MKRVEQEVVKQMWYRLEKFSCFKREHVMVAVVAYSGGGSRFYKLFWKGCHSWSVFVEEPDCLRVELQLHDVGPTTAVQVFLNQENETGGKIDGGER